MSKLAAAASPVAEQTDQEVIPTDVTVAETSDVVIDANPADPSPVEAEDAKEPADLLSVVKSAVAPAEPEESSATVSDPVDEEDDSKADVAKPDATTDADLPFHNHPRWKEVIAERDSFREPAERYGVITDFMQEHGLSNEEVAEGYSVMAMLKSNDPTQLGQAREWFNERLQLLDTSLGNVLPDDLQERVDDGLLDEEGAQEVARTRAAETLRATKQTATEAAQAAASAEQDRAAKTTSMVSAVESWEARVKASDPDYSKKADLVQAKCAAIVQRTGKPPATAEEATQLVDQALSEVNAMFQAALPKRRAITPAPAGKSTVAAVAPTTLREAINSALG